MTKWKWEGDYRPLRSTGQGAQDSGERGELDKVWSGRGRPARCREPGSKKEWMSVSRSWVISPGNGMNVVIFLFKTNSCLKTPFKKIQTQKPHKERRERDRKITLKINHKWIFYNNFETKDKPGQGRGFRGQSTWTPDPARPLPSYACHCPL